ncbi:MAG: hypothetical protein AAFX06_26775 [Planctomycetota bacterium]
MDDRFCVTLSYLRGMKDLNENYRALLGRDDLGVTKSSFVPAHARSISSFTALPGEVRTTLSDSTAVLKTGEGFSHASRTKSKAGSSNEFQIIVDAVGVQFGSGDGCSSSHGKNPFHQYVTICALFVDARFR